MTDDLFELYDLKISVEEIRGTCTCGHAVGDYFELRGGQLSMPLEKVVLRLRAPVHLAAAARQATTLAGRRLDADRHPRDLS